MSVTGAPFDELVAQVAELGTAELATRLVALESERRRVEAELAVVVAEAERRAVFTADGHRSVRGWVSALTRCSAARSRHVQRLGRLARQVPAAVAALHEASIGVDQAAELARAGANPRCGEQLADIADVLVEQAARQPFADFCTCVRRWEMLADVDGAWRAQEAAEAQRTASIVNVDGVCHLHARGAGAQGAVMAEIFARFLDAEFRTDCDGARARYGGDVPAALLARTDAQRRFDALYEIFLAAAAAPPDAVAPAPLVNLVVDQVTFETHLVRRRLLGRVDPPAPVASPLARRCETLEGALLHPEAVVDAALVGHVRRVVFDSPSSVIDLGHRRRLFTGSARDAALLQSARCTHDGCTVPGARCQVDHLTPWAGGGATDVDNGGPKCHHHNQFARRRGYRTRRDPDGTWHTFRPDGTEITEPPAA
jgi:hypothetical protein